jgi:hypothetical protein
MENAVIIESVHPALTDEWDSIWRDCEYATYFHSREWAEIWCEYTRGRIVEIRPHGLMVSFSDGKDALISLSVRKVLKYLLPRYLSTPSGCFGGWISSHKLMSYHEQLMRDYLFNSFSSLSLRLNPYQSTTLDLSGKGGNEEQTAKVNGMTTIMHILIQ